MITRIRFMCTAGHEQVITYTGMTHEYAESVAKLTDGTSPLYKFPPGPESSIGKCGFCGSQLTSEVLDEPSVDSVNNPPSPASPSGT